MRSLLLLLPLCAAACAERSPMPIRAAGYECRETALGQFRGQVVTQDVAMQLLSASGAKTIRWVRPGEAVTMDYSPSRLTVRLDAQNRIEGLSCG